MKEDKYLTESVMIITDSEDEIILHKSIKLYNEEKNKASDCIKNHLKEVYDKDNYMDIYKKFKISFSFKTSDKAIDIPTEMINDIIKILDISILENQNKTEYIVFYYVINNPIIKYKTIYTIYNDKNIDEQIIFYKESGICTNPYDLILRLSGKFNYKEDEKIDKLIQKIRSFAKFITI